MLAFQYFVEIKLGVDVKLKVVPYAGRPGKPPKPTAEKSCPVGTSEVISEFVLISPSFVCHHGPLFTVKLQTLLSVWRDPFFARTFQ